MDQPQKTLRKLIMIPRRTRIQQNLGTAYQTLKSHKETIHHWHPYGFSYDLQQIPDNLFFWYSSHENEN